MINRGGVEPDAFDCGPGIDKILDFNESEGDTKMSNCEFPATVSPPQVEPTAVIVAIIGVIGSVLGAAKGKIRWTNKRRKWIQKKRNRGKKNERLA